MYIKNLEDGVFYLVFKDKQEKRAVFNGMRLAVKNGLIAQVQQQKYSLIKSLSRSAAHFDWNKEGELAVPVSVNEIPRLLNFLIMTLGGLGVLYDTYKTEVNETIELSEKVLAVLERQLYERDREIASLKRKEDTGKRHGYS
jgi:hypothetical protein